MKIEIEKKYELTDLDLNIIKDKCELKSEKTVTDYYLDDSNLTLFKNRYRLRLRNGRYELKIKEGEKIDNTSRSIEIEDEVEIEKRLSEFNLSTDWVSWVLAVEKYRESYTYHHNWYEFTIDVDKFKYNKRYEVELCLDDDTWIDATKLIEELRTHLWLTSEEMIHDGSIVETFAMHENIDLYEVLLEAK